MFHLWLECNITSCARCNCSCGQLASLTLFCLKCLPLAAGQDWGQTQNLQQPHAFHNHLCITNNHDSLSPHNMLFISFQLHCVYTTHFITQIFLGFLYSTFLIFNKEIFFKKQIKTKPVSENKLIYATFNWQFKKKKKSTEKHL